MNVICLSHTITLVLIILEGCSNPNSTEGENKSDQKPGVDEVSHINLSKKTTNDIVKLSDVADTVLYIPLETNKNSLLGQIRSVDLNDSVFVLTDKKRILVFGMDGKFIREIGKNGKGPGEHLSIFKFLLDRDTIYISSTGKYGIDKYSLDGKYHGYIHLGVQMICFTKNMDGGYAWYDLNHGSVVFFDRNWNITDTVPVEYNVDSGKRALFSLSGSLKYLINTGQRLLFNNYRNDTIWDISTGTKKPAIIFNLGKKLLPDHLLPEYTKSSFEQKAHPYDMVEFMLTDSFIFVNQHPWTSLKPGDAADHFCVYSRITNEVKSFIAPLIYDDLIGETVIYCNLSLQNNSIISWFQYPNIERNFERAKSPKSKEFWGQMLKKMDENSNPVLILVKPK